MNFFEFVLIITSVIYALCLAPLLSGVARLVQFDGKVKLSLPQAAFALYLFFLVVILWWTMWWFRDVDWHFATYLFMAIEPAVMFLACSLIFPQPTRDSKIDLEEHYYRIRIPLLSSVLLINLLAFSDGVLLGIEEFWHDRRYVQIVSVTLLIAALASKRKVFQSVAAVGNVMVEVVLMVVWFWDPAG